LGNVDTVNCKSRLDGREFDGSLTNNTRGRSIKGIRVNSEAPSLTTKIGPLMTVSSN